MSIFQMHNETVNIWTHFIGFIVCSIVMFTLSCTQIGEHIKKRSSQMVEIVKNMIE